MGMLRGKEEVVMFTDWHSMEGYQCLPVTVFEFTLFLDGCAVSMWIHSASTIEGAP